LGDSLSCAWVPAITQNVSLEFKWNSGQTRVFGLVGGF
jgi:hypothetical protein